MPARVFCTDICILTCKRARPFLPTCLPLIPAEPVFPSTVDLWSFQRSITKHWVRVSCRAQGGGAEQAVKTHLSWPDWGEGCWATGCCSSEASDWSDDPTTGWTKRLASLGPVCKDNWISFKILMVKNTFINNSDVDRVFFFSLFSKQKYHKFKCETQ